MPAARLPRLVAREGHDGGAWQSLSGAGSVVPRACAQWLVPMRGDFAAPRLGTARNVIN